MKYTGVLVVFVLLTLDTAFVCFTLLPEGMDGKRIFSMILAGYLIGGLLIVGKRLTRIKTPR